MNRSQALLAAALLASALALVHSAYQTRRLFAELERLKAEQVQLDAESKLLQAERQTQGTHGRVERTARDRLAMRNATPALVEYVDDPAAARVLARAPAKPR